MWSGFCQGESLRNPVKQQGNKRLNEKRIHPTQKPVALYKWLLQNYTKEGDLILDTHVGSASSLIACEVEGFHYVGYEIDEEYYRDSVERMKKELAPLKDKNLLSKPIKDKAGYPAIGLFKTNNQ